MLECDYVKILYYLLYPHNPPPTAPMLSNTAGDSVLREDYQTAQLVALILELLCFCVEHHSYHMKNYIIHRDLLNRVLVLLKSKHTFLVLCKCYGVSALTSRC